MHTARVGVDVDMVEVALTCTRACANLDTIQYGLMQLNTFSTLE